MAASTTASAPSVSSPPSAAPGAPSAPSSASARRDHRQHPAATTEWRLGWRNVYVLPTRSGWMLMGVLLVLLLASINYQLSLGYLLTFLLAGSVAAGVGVAHANLRGLQLHALPPEPVFAGQTVRLQLRLTAPATPRGRTRRAIFVALGDKPSPHDPHAWSWTDVDAGANALMDLGFAAPERGHLPLPRVTVQTLFPLGAFRLWSHWQPAQHAWAYPTPETPSPALRTGTAHDPAPDAPHHTTQPSSRPSTSEPDGVRAYQRGDPLRHIVWKKAAQALSTGSDQLVSRAHHSLHTDQLWLDEAATGLPQLEARLSRLSAWVQQLQHHPSEWGLRLNTGVTIAPAQGVAHYHRCLQTLAQHGLLRSAPTPQAPV